MKRLTIQFFAIAFAVIVFSATDAVAQGRVNFNSSGTATISATIKPMKTGDTHAWSISGKQFDKLNFKQTNSGKFKYEIRRGSSFLSSGHTTGSNIQVQSDGNSTYTITIINEEENARPITLSLTKTGGGS